MDSTAVPPSSKTLVLGLGNAMLSDLGVGIEVIHRLRRQRPRPEGIDLVRAGLVNVSLGELIGVYDRLIVVEARPIGGEPGRIVEFQGPRMDDFLRHQTGDDAMLADLLGLLDAAGRVPARRALLVMQPASAQVGHGLSRPVAAALPEMLERILTRARGWRGGGSARHPSPGAFHGALGW